MISNHPGDHIIFECDGLRCNESLDTATYNFTNALDRMREAGWITTNRGGSWEHFCAACQEERQAERRKQLADLAKKFQGE